jgi:SNF2 family DNA or RNA helicase
MNKTAKALRQASEGVERRVALTGTPVENKLNDLRNIFDFILPTYFGATEKDFALLLQSQNGRERVRNSAKPFMLRRRKHDPDICSELPAKVEKHHLVTMPQAQRDLHNLVQELYFSKRAELFARNEVVRWAMPYIHDMRRVCGHPCTFSREKLDRTLPYVQPKRLESETLAEAEARIQGILDHEARIPGLKNPGEHYPASAPVFAENEANSAKTEHLMKIVEEVQAIGEKALIFCQYISTIAFLRRLCDRRNFRSLTLTGEVEPDERKKVCDRFQTDQTVSLLFLTIGVGGVGLTLTAATHVIHFDRCYNPAKEDQATDRAHRIGQKSMVTVHILTCENTFEDRLSMIIDAKRDIAKDYERIDLNSILAYDDDQLRSLFACSGDAKSDQGRPEKRLKEGGVVK